MGVGQWLCIDASLPTPEAEPSELIYFTTSLFFAVTTSNLLSLLLQPALWQLSADSNLSAQMPVADVSPTSRQSTCIPPQCYGCNTICHPAFFCQFIVFDLLNIIACWNPCSSKWKLTLILIDRSDIDLLCSCGSQTLRVVSMKRPAQDQPFLGLETMMFSLHQFSVGLVTFEKCICLWFTRVLHALTIVA